MLLQDATPELRLFFMFFLCWIVFIFKWHFSRAFEVSFLIAIYILYKYHLMDRRDCSFNSGPQSLTDRFQNISFLVSEYHLDGCHVSSNIGR